MSTHYGNGIQAETGDYWSGPIKPDSFLNHLTSKVFSPGVFDQCPRLTSNGTYRHVSHGLDADRIDQVGWGIIFAKDDPLSEDIKNAIQPLLACRRDLAGKKFHILVGELGYHQGDTLTTFLKRHGELLGNTIGPEHGLPYYLLLIGGPEVIPFEFQWHLGSRHAVGRLAFDQPDDYGRYALAVADQDASCHDNSPDAVLFAPVHSGDQATQSCRQFFIDPLADHLSSYLDTKNISSITGELATKERLLNLFTRERLPSLLLTAGHGMCFRRDSSRQISRQGALLCADWPGREQWQGSIPDSFYLAAEDLNDNHHFSNMIVFLFACFSGGTPANDHFSFLNPDKSGQIADKPFIARLPQAMLTHANGNALAVIAHVDRTWTHSFYDDLSGTQTDVFHNTLLRLLEGSPLGHAMEFFSMRHLALAADLLRHYNLAGSGLRIAAKYLAAEWTAHNDARNYVIFGDPAVRLRARSVRDITRSTQEKGSKNQLPPMAIEHLVGKADWELTPPSVKAMISKLIEEKK